MFVIKNNSGLGNQIKNLVSYLRLGAIQNKFVKWDNPLINFNQRIDELTADNKNIDYVTDWRLLLTPQDLKKGVLKKNIPTVVVNNTDDVNIFYNSIDFQFTNIQDWVFRDFLDIFKLINFSKEITDKIDFWFDNNNVNIDTIIGVHVRSWTDDLNRQMCLYDFNLIMESLKKHPNSQFFVCSDDLNITNKLDEMFPEQIIKQPLNFYECPKFKALFDLLVLSKCCHLIGTYQSTFTECAWWLGHAKMSIDIIKPSFVDSLHLAVK